MIIDNVSAHKRLLAQYRQHIGQAAGEVVVITILEALLLESAWGLWICYAA
jgi:hypothetical protein